MTVENLKTEPTPGTALITGASSGIGAVYADRLATRGYDLIVVARDAERLSRLAQGLSEKAGVQVEVLKADLTSRADLDKVEARLRSDQLITLLVNNAGIGGRKPVLEEDIDYLESMVELNVVAFHRLAITAAQVFAKRQRGGIINIGSVVALLPERFTTSASYNASKAFVLGLTLALEPVLSQTGVTLQVVLPGLTRTEIFERVGRSFAEFPAEILMETTDLVDAALAGFDQGELITIPSLPDPADWDAVTRAREALAPNISHQKPARRYGVTK
ncbi:MAG: SDR family oxidoreductase [Verrucomicrobia bacterium]|nr:SDR family oxidoreductase [Verrucomicrobiota bacterium]